MRYLIDTNILLEVLLGQSRAPEAKQCLIRALDEGAVISDFTLYSIGIRLFRDQKHHTYKQIVDDLFGEGGCALLSLPLSATQLLIEAATQYKLDFDDAYQYAIAEHYDLSIISFDSDFDRTPRGRKEPSEVIASP